MTVNRERLRQTLAYVEEHEAEWEQGDWTSTVTDPGAGKCWTAHCFAGWAIVLEHPDAVFDHDRVTVNGSGRWVKDLAAELLGITHLRGSGYRTGWALFEPANSLGDLRRIVGELCDDEEEAA